MGSVMLPTSQGPHNSMLMTTHHQPSPPIISAIKHQPSMIISCHNKQIRPDPIIIIVIIVMTIYSYLLLFLSCSRHLAKPPTTCPGVLGAPVMPFMVSRHHAPAPGVAHRLWVRFCAWRRPRLERKCSPAFNRVPSKLSIH